MSNSVFPKECEELIPNIGECGESVWVTWYECSACNCTIQYGQEYCERCNKKLSWKNLIKLNV